jgi:putative transposase
VGDFYCKKKTTGSASGQKSFSYGEKIPPRVEWTRSANRINYKRRVFMKDTDSLAHTKWNCKYHVVFAAKYRRQIIYNELKKEIGQILRKLCEQKGVEIIEAEACPDHIHMLLSIPPKLSVSYVIGYLKGKSSLMIFDRHANMKYKYGNRHFWCRGYYVDTVDQL